MRRSVSVPLTPHLLLYSFARSPELFADTCAKLFARMIDIVPRDVEAGMTDIVQPLSVRPHGVSVVHDVDAKVLNLSGEVRVRVLSKTGIYTAEICTDMYRPAVEHHELQCATCSSAHRWRPAHR